MPAHADTLPLHYLLTWAPFKIDALGLVTLLGAADVNKAVGRLVRSRYTTFLPILGAFVIAGNDFTNPASAGYTLYNVTDSITTTILGGWFSRWLEVQPLNAATTIFEWVDSDRTSKTRWRDRFTNAIGILPLLGLIAITLMIGDYWGFSNALAMAFSIFVRWYLVHENVKGLDQASHGHSGSTFEDDNVKVLITSPNGNMVTLYVTRKVVLQCITRTLTPPHPIPYLWVRGLGWFSFGVHIISLGQSCLVSQIYTVVLLVGSTFLVVKGVGCDEEAVGYRTRLRRIVPKLQGPDRRMWAYAKLQPTKKEEERMLRWGLLPDRDNESWWREFEEAKLLATDTPRTPKIGNDGVAPMAEPARRSGDHIGAQTELEIELAENEAPTPYISQIQ
jgi:hypothetical protein